MKCYLNVTLLANQVQWLRDHGDRVFEDLCVEITEDIFTPATVAFRLPSLRVFRGPQRVVYARLLLRNLAAVPDQPPVLKHGQSYSWAPPVS